MRVELDQSEILARAGLTVAGLYDELTDARTRAVRLDELVYAAAERVPGLVPARAELEAERERPLAEKHGVERAQGLLLAEFLALPETGGHFLAAMLDPRPL